MKGYKGYKKGLICRGKQYAVGEVFEEDSAEICKSGMHFCKNPLDILVYYPLIDTNGNLAEFTEVEALDEPKTDDGEKFCTKKLKIGAKLSLSQFIKESFSATYESIKAEAKKSSDAQAGGDNATLAGGEKSLIVGGDGSIAKGGIGSVILLVTRDEDGNITAYKAIKIDGKRHKADVFYTLGKDGKVKVAE